jgi:hypothetical protein
MTDQQDLKRVQRDIRLSRAEDFRSRAQSATSAEDFAQSVIDRYAGITAGRPGLLERVYRRLAFGVFLQRIYQRPAHTPPTLPVRLALTLLFPRLESSPAGEPSAQPPEPALPRSEMPLAEQLRAVLTRRFTRESRTEETARHIITRSRQIEERITASARRVEAGSRSQPPGDTTGRVVSPAAANQPPVTPVSRVFTRSAPASQEGGSAPTLPHEPTTASTVRHSSGDSAPTDSPPVDLNRLTDEVIRAIDRRIIAQRERLGRN